MERNEYTKWFFEERSKTYHKTLKAAKAADSHPYVWRVWKRMLHPDIRRLVFAYGDPVTTIKLADEDIMNEINLKTQ